jgi:PAB-dependent poly(A)-specific ribonuclease subunit 2
MPYYKENLLSSWPSHVIFEVGAPPPKIDASILNSMTRTDLGFFAKNPRTKRRNQAEDTRQSDRAIDSLNAPKFLSEQSRSALSYSSDNDAKMAETMETLTDLHLDDVTRKDVPSMYGNVEIKYSKFGVDDFDFAYGFLPSWQTSSNVLSDTTIKHLSLASKPILQTRTPTRFCSYSASRP